MPEPSFLRIRSWKSLTASTAAESLEKAKEGITADRNGVVTDVQIVDGSPVSEGAALFKISSLDDVKVDISVTKIQSGEHCPGAESGHHRGRKILSGNRVQDQPDRHKNDSGTPVVGAQIHIDNPDAELFLGVEARVSVHMAKSEGVVLVPVEAVNTGTSGSFCWVINSEGVVEKRTVETGVSSSEYTEITSGIASGEYVISDASAEALEGSKGSTGGGWHHSRTPVSGRTAGRSRYMAQLLEYIKMALENIRANKGRSILTMLGIIIGDFLGDHDHFHRKRVSGSDQRSVKQYGRRAGGDLRL